jgi:anthranilate phosphoribosyltransferase
MDLRRDDGFGGTGDAFYEALIRGHEGLSEAESAALNARLVLILANQVGDLATLIEAIHLARKSVRPEPSGAPALPR